MQVFKPEQRLASAYKKNKESFFHRVKSMLMPFMFATLSLSAEAQQQPPKASIDSSTMEIKYEHNLDSVQYEKIKKIALEQHAWLLEFMNSQKFYEIMSRQYMIAKKFDFPANENDLISKLFTIKVDENGDTLALVDLHLRGVDIIKGDFFPDEEVMAFFKPENIFGVDLGKVSKDDARAIQNLINQRIKRVQNSPWVILDMKYKIEDGEYYAKSSASLRGVPLQGAVAYNIYPSVDATTVPVHEKTHASLDYKKYIFPTTTYVIENNFQGKDPYYKDASEVIPRLNSVRYIMNKLGLFDPSKETFEKKHLELLKSKDVFEKDYQIEQLINFFSEEYIIWFMNNIASNYPNTPEFIFSKDFFDSNIS